MFAGDVGTLPVLKTWHPLVVLNYSSFIILIGVFQLLIELILTLNIGHDQQHVLHCRQLLQYMSDLCTWSNDNCKLVSIII